MGKETITAEQIKDKLSVPFDSSEILKYCKKWKRILQEVKSDCMYKKIAVLGGSTTKHLKDTLELFLMREGIQCDFYESEYNRYWEEGVFENRELEQFSPDIIYVFTSYRNLNLDEVLECQYDKYEQLWEKLQERYHCTILQNNFELPFYRLLGNQDAVLNKGDTYYINRMNEKLYTYAGNHNNFYVVDLHYLAAEFGLSKWYDLNTWYLYKYAFSLEAVPLVAWNVSRIIKAMCGKNKKGFVLDLDNTLWGGVVGEDGPDHIEIGEGTPVGEAYLEFQKYIKRHEDLGIVLNICSRNDICTALEGIQKEENLLKQDDFFIIQSNWNRKDENLKTIAEKLNVSVDSLVFLDDNPAEREIVNQNLPAVETPSFDSVEHYIQLVDQNHYFEVLNLSQEDQKRNDMYRENKLRKQEEERFQDYGSYLRSLDMKARIHPFQEAEWDRIFQLVQKSNQFNLTTKRYTMNEIQEMSKSPDYMTLSGRLRDRFGDNGIVSLIVVQKEDETAHIRLWVMSCRVLGRNMEYAMFDALLVRCRQCGIRKIKGYYFPTDKNGLVKDLFQRLGFEHEDGCIWCYDIPKAGGEMNEYIAIQEEGD